MRVFLRAILVVILLWTYAGAQQDIRRAEGPSDDRQVAEGSPDERQLAEESSDERQNMSNLFGYDIFSLDPGTFEIPDLVSVDPETDQHVSTDVRAVVSADGLWVAYVVDNWEDEFSDVRVVGVDGSGDRLLHHDPGPGSSS